MSSTAWFVIGVVAVALVIVASGLGGLWWAVRMRRDVLRGTALEDLPWREGNRALKRACRGPVPEDPDERVRMAAVVVALLEERRRMMRWSVPFFAVLGVLQAVLFVLGPTIVGALNVVWPAVLVVGFVAGCATLRRRLAALTERPGLRLSSQ